MRGTAVRRWKIVALVSVLVAVSSVLLRAAPSTAPSNPVLEKLKKERVDILQEAVGHAISAFNAGGSSYGEVFNRSHLLYEAQLDMAQSRSKRMEILQSMLTSAESLQQYEQLLFGQGKASPGDLADAKVAKLDVEIAIAKEQSR